MRSLLVACLIVQLADLHAQQTLFFDDLEGGAPAFALNTTDQGSTASGANRWSINAVYQGGNGTLDCLGFPFSFTIPNTAAQPAGITSPNGRYLHVASEAGITSGILNCNFVAADGLCTQTDNHFARMTSDVSTLGASEASLSFWWLCGGSAANHGEVYYSTNGGTSWSLITAPIAQYRDQLTWTQQTITSAAFGGHATLRFGFRFVNGTTTTAQDPGFGVDDVRITVPEPVELGLTTDNPSGDSYCAGSTISIPYDVTGTWNVGNSFTAQLSDASGSFAAPVVIGTLASTTGGVINATIPAGTASGTGYRVRVVASAPAFVGASNTSAFSIEQAAVAGADEAVTLCKNTGTYPLFPLLAGADACGSWTRPNGQAFNGEFDSAADVAGVYTYTTDCSLICPADEALLTITLQDPANAGNAVTVPLCSDDPPTSLFPYISGGQLTGLFFYNGMTFPMPDYSEPGTYEVNYVVYGTAPCANDTAVLQLIVNEAPNAGVSTTLTICSNSGPVDLFTSLGAATANGTWADPDGAPFSGMLDPVENGSGLYTYTVEGEEPCEQDEAFVAVIVDPCLGVEERAAERLRWLGNSGTDLLFASYPGAASIVLTDALGRVCGSWQKPERTDRFVVPMADQRTGVYTLTLIGPEGRVSLRIPHVR